jgi:hypothetical protein
MIPSLVALWNEMMQKQVVSWCKHRGIKDPKMALKQMQELLAAHDAETIDKILSSVDDIVAYG